MKFNSTKRSIRKAAPSGEIYEPTFKMIIDDYGHRTIIKSGENNILLPVQEALESTKIENIIRRAMMGDTAALNQKHGQYVDATTMPKTLAEAQKIIIEAHTTFNKLPTEEKEKYGFEPERYIENLSKEITKKMNETKGELKTEKEEAKENEQKQ